MSQTALSCQPTMTFLPGARTAPLHVAVRPLQSCE
jgi:hypothetical protein